MRMIPSGAMGCGYQPFTQRFPAFIMHLEATLRALHAHQEAIHGSAVHHLQVLIGH